MDGIVSLLTTTEGRIGRKQWWIGTLVMVAIAVVLTILLSLISFGNIAALSWGGFVIGVLVAWPAYCIGVKRRHDRDNDGKDLMTLIAASLVLNLAQVLGIGMVPGEFNGIPVMVPDTWLMALQFLVFVFAVYVLVQVGFLKGTTGPNQYGPDPLGTA